MGYEVQYIAAVEGPIVVQKLAIKLAVQQWADSRRDQIVTGVMQLTFQSVGKLTADIFGKITWSKDHIEVEHNFSKLLGSIYHHQLIY